MGAIGYVPGMARHTLSVEYAVLKTSSLRAAGVIDENGNARLKGMEFDIVVYSKMPGGGELSEQRKYRHCTFASGSVTVQSHRVVMSDATFNARSVTGSGL